MATDTAAAAYEQYKKNLPWLQDDSDDDADNNAASDAASAAGSPSLNSSPTKAISSPARPQISASRASSPGLFVNSRDASPIPAARSSEAEGEADSDPDLPSVKRFTKELFQQKVAEKKAEREAKEKALTQQSDKDRRRQKLAALSSRVRAEKDVEDSDSSLDEAEKAIDARLTQQSARPTARQASRRAREEMNNEIRENQRFSRSLQLAHQTKVKKKITKDDLFKRFNFRQPVAAPEVPSNVPESPQQSASSPPDSFDIENHVEIETPPTSPLREDDSIDLLDLGKFMFKKPKAVVAPVEDDEDLPDVHTVLNEIPKLVNKGKAPAEILRNTNISDSDDDLDDLEILPSKSRFPVFDRLPAAQKKESRSMRTLRALAHLTSPGKSAPKDPKRPQVTASELQARLMANARAQARARAEERIERAMAAGNYKSKEEVHKENLAIESFLEKARKEAELQGEKEKAQRKQNGEVDEGDLLPSDDEDEDFANSESDEEEVILSGSEDEEDADEKPKNTDDSALIDAMAAEDNEEIEEAEDDEYELGATAPRRGIARKRLVIDDEDEDEDIEAIASTPKQLTQEATQADDVAAAFGFGKIASSPALGLTQMFAGSMAVMSQTPRDSQINATTQDSLDLLRNVPFSSAPDFDQVLGDDSQASIVQESQPNPADNTTPEKFTSNDLSIDLGVSQFPVIESHGQPHTQDLDLPEPTQDAGFQIETPAGFRKEPHSTVDTVVLPTQASPLARRPGRLQRRLEMAAAALDEDEAVPEVDSDGEGDLANIANAFSALKKGAKKQKAAATFDKKRSEAKGMVEDQAEESEDEYAGLGGEDNDRSDDEANEEDVAMIDHDDIDDNELDHAELFGQKARADDERNVNRIGDIVSGKQRRKRIANGDFGLDTDDTHRLLIQQRKQAEFQRSIDALFETDKRYSKIATNPKKTAFFNTLKDYDLHSDSENDNEIENENGTGEEPAEPESIPDSQTDAATIAMPPPPALTAMANDNPLKRKATEDVGAENRLPPNLRRTGASGNKPTVRRPLSEADIQRSISELLEEPNRIPDSQQNADDEDEDSDLEIESQPRPDSADTSKPVIDRLTLSRQSSIAEVSGSHLAFHTSTSTISRSGFRVPSLIRRATSNLSNASATSSGASTPTTEGTKIRQGGSKKSNIHYQAREAERRRVLEAAESRRKGELKKKVRAGGSGGLRGALRAAGSWD